MKKSVRVQGLLGLSESAADFVGQAGLRPGIAIARGMGIALAVPASHPRIKSLRDIAASHQSFTAAAPRHETQTGISSAADLGRMVRAAREALGYPQQRFAVLAGVGRRFLSELENGKATLEFDKVIKVANAAGIDLAARKR